MRTTSFFLAKLIVAISWVYCVASFFVMTETAAASGGRLLFWLMVVAHPIEFALFLSTLRAASGSLPGHFLRTLLFGLLHIIEVRDGGIK